MVNWLLSPNPSLTSCMMLGWDIGITLGEDIVLFQAKFQTFLFLVSALPSFQFSQAN